MRIVIDIDDNLYTRLFDNGVDNYDDAVDMAKAIRKGIPLPKGHGRLIDADALKMDIRSNYGYEEYEKSEFCSEIDDALTIVEADKEQTE